MRRIIRIRRQGFVGEHSDNIFSKFQPILVQGLPTWNSKCKCNSPIFYFRKTEELKFGGIPSVMRLSHQGRNRRGINFLYNNRSVTVNMEQEQISHEIMFWFPLFAFETLRIDWLIFEIMSMSVKMPKARSRSPRKCKRTKGNAGADVVNRNSTTDASSETQGLLVVTVRKFNWRTELGTSSYRTSPRNFRIRPAD